MLFLSHAFVGDVSIWGSRKYPILARQSSNIAKRDSHHQKPIRKRYRGRTFVLYHRYG